AQMTPSAFNGDLSTLFPEGFAQPPSGLSLRDMALSFQFLGLVPSLTVGDGTSSNRQLHFNAVDTLSMVKGSHALKLGADFRALYPNISSATYNFSANFWSPIGAAPCNSSQPMPGAAPTPGAPALTCGNSTDLSVTYGSGDFRFQNWSFFVQDTWKATSRLTLTYGARYEIDPAPSSTNGKPYFSLTNWDPVQCTTVPSFSGSATTLCNVGINPLGTAPYPTRWENIAPRIGIAYQVFEGPKWGTVLRGGFGSFYDAGNNAASTALGPFSPSNLFPNPGATSFNCVQLSNASAIKFPISSALASCIALPAVQTDISPSSPYTSPISAMAPNLKFPRVYQFNVALQQALGGRQTLTATYAGATGRGLIAAVFTYPLSGLSGDTGGAPVVIPVSPTFQGPGVTVYGNYATSDYHSLQVQFQRRFVDGLGATASYTWSHSMDDASNFNGGRAFPLTHNRSSSDFDIRHTFSASMVYNIPVPFKDKSFTSAILGHWSVAPMFRLQTAGPVNIALRQALQGLQVLTLRPTLIPGIPFYVHGAQCADQNGGKSFPRRLGS